MLQTGYRRQFPSKWLYFRMDDQDDQASGEAVIGIKTLGGECLMAIWAVLVEWESS